MEICQEAGQKITTFYYGKRVRRLFRLFASPLAVIIPAKVGKRFFLATFEGEVIFKGR
jgi:hypothetical protein